jgi:hypothetical protein
MVSHLTIHQKNLRDPRVSGSLSSPALTLQVDLASLLEDIVSTLACSARNIPAKLNRNVLGNLREALVIRLRIELAKGI